VATTIGVAVLFLVVLALCSLIDELVESLIFHKRVKRLKRNG
jgi:hypothetical protein